MDEIERLTSYLDGELEAGERRALEAELAGDQALRERLAALRGADQALGALGATELPSGARRRLDARLAGVLEEVLSTTPEGLAAPPPPTAATADDAPAPSTGTDGGDDELSLRRRRRVRPAVTGVAAGLVLLAGGLVGLGQLDLGADDARTAESVDAMMSADDAELAPAEPPGADGEALAPVVIDDGRSTSTAELEALLASPELEALADQALSAGDGEVVAARFQQLLLGGVPPMTSGSVADAEEDEEADRSVEPTIVTRDGRTLDSDDAGDLRRCLATLLKDGEQAIPTRVELLEFDGTPAVSVGLVTPDPQSGAFTRIEVWTLEQATCQVLRFDQV